MIISIVSIVYCVKDHQSGILLQLETQLYCPSLICQPQTLIAFMAIWEASKKNGKKSQMIEIANSSKL